MSSTQAVLLGYAQSRLGGRTDLNTLLGEEFNNVATELAMSFDFRELDKDDTFACVDGTEEYAVPATMLFLTRDLVLENTTSSAVLHQVAPSTYRKRYPLPSANATGVPVEYCHYGGYFYLAPRPNSTYTVSRYFKVVPGDIGVAGNLLPVQFDRVIVNGATYRVLRALGRHEEANAWQAAYTRELAMSVQILSLQPARMVRIRGGDEQVQPPGAYWARPDVGSSPEYSGVESA